MKIFRTVGKAFKPLVNFPRWMGWREISATGRNIEHMAKDVFATKKSEHKETFEQAVQRLGLTEKDISQRKRNFFRLAIIYCVFGILLLSYSVYLLIWSDYFIQSLITLILSVLAFSLSYREHFWYFQVKTRKLGQSFKDWFAFTFKVKGLKK